MQRREFLAAAPPARRRRRSRLPCPEPPARRGGQARGPRARARIQPHADRPLRRPDDGEPLFDHYFGWLPARTASRTAHLSGPRQRRRRATRHASSSEPASGRVRASGPGHGWDDGRRGARPTTVCPGRQQRRVRALLLRRRRPRLPRRRPRSRSTTGSSCSLMGSTGRPHAGPRSRGGPAATRRRPHARQSVETVFDRAIALDGVTARYYNCDLPFSAVWGRAACRGPRPWPDFYADCAAGTLPNVAFVDPAFPRRRRRRRGLARRAPARRRAPRPGVHVRRRPRLHGVAPLGARRALHRLRRVGRVLRPRAPAAGADGRRSSNITRTSARWARASRRSWLPVRGAAARVAAPSSAGSSRSSS